jgi:PREDICTED: similar to GA21164-PA
MIQLLHKGKQVKFGGNPLYCDCSLKDYLRWFLIKKAEHFPTNSTILANVTCSSPQAFEGKLVEELKFEHLKCPPDVKFEDDFDLDLKPRGVEKLRGMRKGVRVVWFVVNKYRDISGFKIVLLTSDGKEEKSDKIAYNTRAYVFPNLTGNQNYRICLKAFDSFNNEMPFKASQCITTRIDNIYTQLSDQRLFSTKYKASAATTIQSNVFTFFVILFLIAITSIQY